MAYGVLAYPAISEKDYRGIQTFRKAHDELYFSVAEPHFAFVFPVFDVDRESFIREVSEKAKGVRQIDFEIRCSTVNKDAFLDYFHLLLVPDQGYSAIVKLHDRLYSGLLFGNLRLDIDFIPHVGIANSKDSLAVKRWADQWNQEDFLIKGSIEKLTIIEYTDNILTNLEDIDLL